MPDPALGGASLSTKLAAGAFLIRELPLLVETGETAQCHLEILEETKVNG